MAEWTARTGEAGTTDERPDHRDGGDERHDTDRIEEDRILVGDGVAGRTAIADSARIGRP